LFSPFADLKSNSFVIVIVIDFKMQYDRKWTVTKLNINTENTYMVNTILKNVNLTIFSHTVVYMAAFL